MPVVSRPSYIARVRTGFNTLLLFAYTILALGVYAAFLAGVQFLPVMLAYLLWPQGAWALLLVVPVAIWFIPLGTHFAWFLWALEVNLSERLFPNSPDLPPHEELPVWSRTTVSIYLRTYPARVWHTVRLTWYGLGRPIAYVASALLWGTAMLVAVSATIWGYGLRVDVWWVAICGVLLIFEAIVCGPLLMDAQKALQEHIETCRQRYYALKADPSVPSTRMVKA